jgi:hypothetical protein
MALRVTAWRLRDPGGTPADCRIEKIGGGGWELLVRHGRDPIITEQFPSDDAAFQRSTDIWSVLVDQGWTDPTR